MAIEIVDLPIKKVIFHSYVSLPEGTYLHVHFNTSGLVIKSAQTKTIDIIWMMGFAL